MTLEHAATANPVAETRTTQRMATASVIALLYFVSAVLLLHILRTEINPAQHFLSEYALGRLGLLMTSAFVGFGLGALCLARALYRSTAGESRSKVGLILLAVFGILTLFAALFPTDPRGSPLTTIGILHIVAGLISFLALIPAMLLISARLKNDTHQRFPYRSLMGISLVALAAFVAFIVFQGSLNAGLFQRAVVGTCVFWLILTAIRLRQGITS
ncbi:MAG: DUF998 domain-containing protein [Candidatus Korobacteraceae bacterium]